MKKICMIATISFTMEAFVVPTALYLAEECGHDVTLICTEDETFASSLPKSLRFIPVQMNRGIDPSGLAAVARFKKIFENERFDMVQYCTPNAALYASIAAKSAKVPIRLYCQWGIRYVGMRGLARKIFKLIERFTCYNSTHIRAASHGNMKFAVEEGLCSTDKISVVGNGGTVGVDMSHYSLEKKNMWRAEIRAAFGIPEGTFVFGFVGRLNTDKGCVELLEAFKSVANINQQDTHLLVVGPSDGKTGVPEQLLTWAKNSMKVTFTGYVPNSDVCRFYAAMDALVHPTYREGFGMVIQEAGALAVPAITTRVLGASEVMVDGESCVLVDSHNSRQLGNAMASLACDPSKAKTLGDFAYSRTSKCYARPIMLDLQLADYEKLLHIAERVEERTEHHG